MKKFRVWDKESKEMNFNCGVAGEYLLVFNSIKEDYCKVSWDNYILMAFTGLTDKHGKDIYEGDIVECQMSWKGGFLPHRGVIVYSQEFASFATKNEAGETLLHNHLLNSFEIIGTVHEHPELIK